MRPLSLLSLGFGLLFALTAGPTPAHAQWENIDTVQGAQGKKTTLTKRPRRLADGLSARALGISAPDTTRWALSLIGADAEDAIELKYGNESLPILDIERPSDGVGPTQVFVSESTFRTIADTKAVRIQVGVTTAAVPPKLRREMGEILRRVR